MNRLRIILRENKTLHEMLIGVLAANILILLIGLVACDDKLMAAIGVAEGAAVAVFYCIHMAVTIDDALCLDERGAASVMRKNMLIRYMVVCVVVAVVCYTEYGNPVLCIFSCLTVKLGAYLQPVIHRILNRSTNNTEEGSESGGEISE